MCSMSGLVSTTLAWRRAHARCSVGVSPSYVTGTRPGISMPARARSWSWARALVGKTRRAVPGGWAETASAIGSW